MYFGISICSFCTFIFSKEAKAGAIDGITLFLQIILPALLCTLIIFSTAAQSRCADAIQAVFGGAVSKILRLPRACAPAVIFGAAGGYPCGAVLKRDLFLSGEIDESEARRIMLFNVNGGIAFTVSAVGTFTLQSTKSGVILWVSQIIASFITALICSFFSKKRSVDFGTLEKRKSFSQAFCSAVESSVKSTLTIGAYIIFFSSLFGIFKAFINLDEKILPLFEITSGICGKNNLSLPEISFFLAFSGICIQLQLLGLTQPFNMSFFEIFASRLANAALSGAVCRIICLLFPTAAPTFSNVGSVSFQFASANAFFSVLLIAGCFVLITDLDAKRKMQ